MYIWEPDMDCMGLSLFVMIVKRRFRMIGREIDGCDFIQNTFTLVIGTSEQKEEKKTGYI